MRVTDQSVDPACYATDKEVCEETKAILAMSSKTNKKKKKKAKDTKAAE